MQEYTPYISDLLNKVIEGLPFLLPELVLTSTFLLSILSGVFLKKGYIITWWIVFIGLLFTSFFTVNQIFLSAKSPIFFGMILPDNNGAQLKLLITITSLLFLVFIHYNNSIRSHYKKVEDLLSILLAVHIGLNMMAMSINWLMTYISIEMVSIGSYIMVGYLSKDRKQSEAALKYVLFGTICSAIMLYGLSLVYGYTGTLTFIDKAHLAGLVNMPPTIFMIAMLFVLTGIGFKLSFVPFHFWSPDVYQGAPTPVTAFLSTAPKIGAITLLGRFVLAWSENGYPMLPQIIFVLLAIAAVASMVLGNFAALWQSNVKRMMAYSSIGHTGFLLMIILTNPARSFEILFFYLAAYVVMNMGVFMLADRLEEGLGLTDVATYKGLGRTYPITMVAMTILMVSLTGLPPTAGFMAKLLAFSAALTAFQSDAQYMWLILLITGAVTTVIALFFYFKIPLNAFLRGDNQDKHLPNKLPLNGLFVIALVLSFLSLLLGIFPAILLDL